MQTRKDMHKESFSNSTIFDAVWFYTRLSKLVAVRGVLETTF